MGIIKTFANDLSSRTIVFLVGLGAIIVFPDFREWIIGIADVLPTSVENVVSNNPVLELILLGGAYYGRKNVRAKI